VPVLIDVGILGSKRNLDHGCFFRLGFTVITPPRNNVPDMTPLTTRHKERGIFTTRLKNEASYICDDHGFYSKAQNVMKLCLVVRGRHVGGVISWGRHDQFPKLVLKY